MGWLRRDPCSVTRSTWWLYTCFTSQTRHRLNNWRTCMWRNWPTPWNKSASQFEPLIRATNGMSKDKLFRLAFKRRSPRRTVNLCICNVYTFFGTSDCELLTFECIFAIFFIYGCIHPVSQKWSWCSYTFCDVLTNLAHYFPKEGALIWCRHLLKLQAFPYRWPELSTISFWISASVFWFFIRGSKKADLL